MISALQNLPPKAKEEEDVGKQDEEIPWAWVRKIRQLVEDPPNPSFQALPIQILPWLYLSDEKNARDVSTVRKLGITHVLTVTGAPSHAVRAMSDNLNAVGIEHRHVHAEDEERYDMLETCWPECRDYLQEVRNGGGRALVHCVYGVNRSRFVVCAAHMVLERESVLDVVGWCVKRRGMVLWNRSFQEQLCVLAAREGLLGEKPEGCSIGSFLVLRASMDCCISCCDR